MAKCDLHIEFDRPDRTYFGGEEITGNVHVSVNADVRCDGLTLETHWKTHGRGNTARGPKEKWTLFEGEWRAGESAKYPFRFAAPHGPGTYRGKYLNIDHYLRARADIPWAFDPKADEEFIVLASPEDNGAHVPANEGPKSHSGGVGPWLGLFAGSGLVIFGILMIIKTSIFGVIPALIGLIIAFFSMRNTLAERRIGKVTFQCTPLRVSSTQNVAVWISFTPRKTTRLNTVTAKLIGKEVCVSGSGTNRTTHTHKFHEELVPLPAPESAPPGETLQIEGNVTIPETYAVSFKVSDNSIVWEVALRVDIPGWPDWTRTQPIIVAGSGPK